jgi:5-methylcytosine-specific restriction protein A
MTRKAWDHGGKSRHQRGYGREHEKMREHLMATVVVCEECRRNGRVTLGTIADHIKPLAAGGTSDRSNYQLLCVDCDRVKLAKDNGRIASARKPVTGLDGWPVEGER